MDSCHQIFYWMTIKVLVDVHKFSHLVIQHLTCTTYLYYIISSLVTLSATTNDNEMPQ